MQNDNTIILRDYQVKAKSEIWKYWRENKGSSPLAVLATGAGKCHPAGTKIIKSTGELVNIEEIQVGDKLLDPEGKIKTVLSVNQGYGNIVEITPHKNGNSWRCNMDHVLSLVSTQKSNKSYPSSNTNGRITDVSVNDWYKWSKTKKHLHKLFHANALEFPEKQTSAMLPGVDNVLISPYHLGMLLGDGGMKYASINMTTMDNEIVQEIYKLADDFKCSITKQTKPNNKASTYNYTKNNPAQNRVPSYLMSEIKKLGLHGKSSNNKFIPEAYKYASIENRLELLAGLIDTDGSLSRTSYDYVSASKQLADDVAFVSRSVGLSVNQSEKVINSKTYYRLSINGNTNKIPVRIERKKAPQRKQKKDVLRSGFKIEKIGKDYYYGFTLDGDGRYLLDDFTVTHNSVLLASIIHDIQAKNPNARIIMATHVKELIEQNMEALLEIYPDVDAGIMSAGLKSRETDKKVIFAGVQTAYRREDLGRFELMIVDECHLISRNAKSMYGKLIANLRAVNPDMRLLGLTATPYRLDSGMLCEGKNALFDGIACEVKTKELVQKGYLCPIRAWAPGKMENLKVERGEFTPESQVLSIEENLQVWADKIVDRTRDLKTLIFVPSVAIAEELSRLLGCYGLNAACISGETKSEDRAALLQAFRSGFVTHMCNVNVMTTGMNIPDITAIVLMRATMSPGLLEQMLGRGLRLAEGKKDCLLLDFGTNTQRLGQYDDIQPPPPKSEKRGKNKKRSQAKTCPLCAFINPIQVLECQNCGEMFPRKSHLINTEAYISGKWNMVNNWKFEYYKAYSGREMIRLECNLDDGKTSHQYFEPFADALSYPHKKFMGMWTLLKGLQNVPRCDLELIADEMNRGNQEPVLVKVKDGQPRFINSIQWDEKEYD